MHLLPQRSFGRELFLVLGVLLIGLSLPSRVEGQGLSVTLNGSHIESVTMGGETIPASRLFLGMSTGASEFLSAGALPIVAADDLDLSSYFARSNGASPEWDIDLGSWSDSNGTLPDFFVFEVGGNDNLDVQAVFEDGSLGQSVIISNWTSVGYSVATGPNSGQAVKGLSFGCHDLKDAAGAFLNPGTTLRGIRITSPTVDGAAFLATGNLAPVQPMVIPIPIGGAGQITGELKKWHRVTITFEGPATEESAFINPFRDYRLNVTFERNGRQITVPGFYAADGDAAETSADSGSRWRVHFTPDEVGVWTYTASFRNGLGVAISEDAEAGSPMGFDGATGSLTIAATDKTGRDFRGKGRLNHVGQRYPRFADTEEYFVKGGANSPENLLGYFEFDDTQDHGGASNALTNGLHHFQPHVADWQTGDPVWQANKGKGIIGALNYLASQGMNAVYFLTMNVDGDGREVYPWMSYGERHRFDVSKLAQWEIVFSHMDRLGLMLHVVTQETENDQLLDNGELGDERKALLPRAHRALLTSPGHHLESGRREHEHRFPDHGLLGLVSQDGSLQPPISLHTFPGQQSLIYTPLLGEDVLDSVSLQVAPSQAHSQTESWDHTVHGGSGNLDRDHGRDCDRGHRSRSRLPSIRSTMRPVRTSCGAP